MRPITHTSAKQLVPVANKPVLFYGLEAIRDAGITAVGMVVGDTEPEIRSAVGSGREFGLDVTYIQQSSPLGLAHAVLMAREFLGEDDFVMYLGDNFIVGGITALVQEFRVARPDAHIMLTANSSTRAVIPPTMKLSPRYITKSSSPRNSLATRTACARPSGASCLM